MPAPPPLVRPLDPGEIPAWDALVAGAPHGALFHESAWLAASGRRHEILGCFRGDVLVGGFVAVFRRPLGLRVVEQAPLTPYGGLVAADPADSPALLRGLAPVLRERYVRVRASFAPGVDAAPLAPAGFRGGDRRTYVLDLAAADPWGAMTGNRRNDIRRAERDGVTVRRDATLEDTLRLVRDTFARKGLGFDLAPAATRYHRLLASQDRSRAFVAEDAAGAAIAAAYVAWDRRRAYYLLGGIDPARAHRGGAASALWAAIRHCRDLGLAAFDFEGSMDPGIARFFARFGGDEVRYATVDWTRPGAAPALDLRDAAAYRLRRVLRRR